jgi:hypothetical protein
MPMECFAILPQVAEIFGRLRVPAEPILPMCSEQGDHRESLQYHLVHEKPKAVTRRCQSG